MMIDNQLGDSPYRPEHTIDVESVDTPEPPMRRTRLYGLPCTKCGAYFFSDEPNCPVCASRRLKQIPGLQQQTMQGIDIARSGPPQPVVKRKRLYGLPCPTCRAYYFSDEPKCPVCESMRARMEKQSAGLCAVAVTEVSAVIEQEK